MKNTLMYISLSLRLWAGQKNKSNQGPRGSVTVIYTFSTAITVRRKSVLSQDRRTKTKIPTQ